MDIAEQTDVRQAASRGERVTLRLGVALVVIHLLDLALRGPATSAIGIVAVVAAATAWLVLQPRLSRATRAALGVSFGLFIAVTSAIGDTVPFITAGPQWDELTGLLATGGGLLLVASGVAALRAPGPRVRRSRRQRIGRTALWLVGAVVFAQVVFIPFAVAFWTVHAPRLPIAESSLGIAHEEVRFPMAGGGKIAGWYVPSRNGAAVIVIHGSSGNRSRVAAHARMLARHGYGVLAIDLPGNGESDGRSNGLGGGAQPAVTAAIDYLERRPDVERNRIAGLGLSLGAELFLEAASSDPRLRAVVADGAERDSDDVRLGHVGGAVMRASHWLTLQIARAISGTRAPAPLVDSIGRIAPRPVLLIASSARSEIPVNRVYRSKIGPSARLWELSDTGHTKGLATHAREYEQRVTGFLDAALHRFHHDLKS